MKTNTKLLLVAAAGNLLCWMGDLLISILPNGRLMTSDLTDVTKLRTLLEGANLNHFSLSAIFGSIAMMAVLCGFYAIFRFLQPVAPKSAAVVMVGGLLGCVPGAVYHVLCTTVMWFYVRLGGGEVVEAAIFDYAAEHGIIIALCCVGLIAACVAIFIAIVRGATGLPRWTGVFNIVILMCVFNALGIPGGMNLGGLGMFLGLYYCITRFKVLEKK